MKKAIIGIIPTTKLEDLENPYNNIYKFVDLYSSCITKNNGIPVGILLDNGNLSKIV